MMKFLNRLLLSGAVFGFLLGTPPVRAAQTKAPSSSSTAHFTPGYLGIYLSGGNGKSVGEPNSQHGKGAEILGVDRDAPAGKVGLKPHDMIVAVNGQPVASDVQLRKILHGMPAGRTIHLKITREGSPRELAVKLASRAEVEASAWPEGVIFADGFPISSGGVGMGGSFSGRDLGPGVRLREFVMLGCDGVDLEPIGSQLAAYFGVPRGIGLLVRNVAPHSVAAAAGLEAGDVITAANGMPSGSLRGWLMVVSQNQGKTVKLKVIRNHKEMLIQYTPGGRRQQSRLDIQDSVQSGFERLVMGESNARLSWFWTATQAGQTSMP